MTTRPHHHHQAVVIGAGPNGLVAANLMADAGFAVQVFEAAAQPGGAVRTAEVTAPGFRNDLYSAFYPMTAASPVMRRLQLDQYGLQWTHAPTVLAHPRVDGPAALLHRRLDDTVDGLEQQFAGEGAAYRAVMDQWSQISAPFMRSLLDPFPPVRGALRLAVAAKPSGLMEMARLSLLPLRRFVEERFDGQAAGLLFAGSALHADLTPETSGSALFGWLLVGLAQQYGFPVPVGGADGITNALVARARDRGVQIACDTRVDRVVVEQGRAVGVVTADGQSHPCGAVLADCDVGKLMLGMVGTDHVPAKYLHRLQRFQRAASTFKIDWALSGPVPWSDPTVHGAGTVHVAESIDELTMTSAQLAVGHMPDKPFLLVGQMTTADPTRSPAGTESLWAYTHVPQDVRADAGPDGLTGRWDPDEVQRFAQRMEGRIEALAPGFGSRVIARHVASPVDFERNDANLVGGDISGGTAQLHQQLIFRPLTGLARAETPIAGLYLASASAHPGGAVHGACGANAARAAIGHARVRRLIAVGR
jgi:phytoene dehydrogenase-like protein